MVSETAGQRVEQWPIDKLVFYARNPRKNDAAVDRMCGSIREFGFKIPVLARSDGEVVDGQTLSGKQAILDRDGRTFEAIAEERRKVAVMRHPAAIRTGTSDDLAAQVGNVLADVFGTELVCRTVEILRQLHADVVRAWLRAPVA
jgi:hypothetical protein